MMTITVEQLEVLVKALAVLLGLVFTFVIKPFIDSKISQTEQAKLIEYIKIETRFERDVDGTKKLVGGKYRNETIEYLKDNT